VESGNMQTITQTQIRAFERCRRFYYLKYIRKLAWPVEKNGHQEARNGADFHLLIRQLILGFPREHLLIPEDNDTIRKWVDHFCSAMPCAGYDLVFAEKETSSLYAGILWLGKFDALAFRDDRLTIFDWKTTAHRPDHSSFRADPQTRLYRFLAKTCGPRLIGSGFHELPAENIEMIYWFPEFPDRQIRLPYSESAYRDDMEYLKLRAREMTLPAETDYPGTDKVRLCRYCEYYAYCFPGNMPFVPEAGDELPEDIFQAEFFFPDIPDDDDREGKSF